MVYLSRKGDRNTAVESLTVCVLRLCMTNDHKLTSSRQHTFIITQLSVGHKSGHGLTGSTALVAHKGAMKVLGRTGFSSEACLEKDLLPSALMLLAELPFLWL